MIWVNKKMIKRKFFPSSEIILHKSDLVASPDGYADILLKWTSDSDLAHLWMIKQEFDKQKIKVRLDIAYMPYSRMDRENEFYAETLSAVCDMINALEFDIVMVHDPHSEETLSLLDNSYPYYCTNQLVEKIKEEIGWDVNKDYIVFPDNGARKKYTALITTMGGIPSINFDNMIYFEKERDFKTGKIIGHKISKDMNFKPEKNSKVIIIDDICSYGTTFMNVAKELNSLGVTDIHLVLSHLEHNITNNFELWYDKDSIIKTISASNSLYEKYNDDNKRLRLLEMYPNNIDGISAKN